MYRSAFHQLRMRSGRSVEECAQFFGCLPSEVHRTELWPENFMDDYIGIKQHRHRRITFAKLGIMYISDFMKHAVDYLASYHWHFGPGHDREKLG